MPQEEHEHETTVVNSNIGINVESDTNIYPKLSFCVILLPMFLVIMSISLSGVAFSNIIMFRTCVYTLEHSKEECSVFLSPVKSNKNSAFEREVERYASFVGTTRTVIEAIIPAFSSLFLGVWSDTYGRKPLVVWPILGLCLTSMMTVVYSLLTDLGPWWSVLLSIPYSLCGGLAILFTGTLCYISDITATEWRSIRMSILEVLIAVGSIIGLLLNAYIIKLVGNIYLLLIASALNVAAYFITSVFMKESLRGALRGGLFTVLDLLLIKEMWRECFKRRPNRGRSQILLLTFANSISILILYGLRGFEYYFARNKLKWTMEYFNTYSAVTTALNCIGAIAGVIVLLKVMRFSDLTVAMVSLLSAAVAYIVKAFANDAWDMYAVAVIAMFSGLSAPLIRSLLSKILPIVDLAKIFALMSAVEGFCPVLGPPMYNALYTVTMVSFPGSIYILSGGLALTSLIMLGYVQYYRWNVSSPYELLQS